MDAGAIIIGSAILVASLLLNMYVSDQIDEMNQYGVFDEIVREIDDESKEEYQTMKIIKYGSTAGIVIGGIILLVGFVKSGTDKKKK
ncbi:hypothetical protein Metev_0629 [Methanohalobium evestigatum Z-7303]|uniref:Uncharacterized protein n=1 Tax=Methanohalobium evestigatum (strain ATCC BAA-1072 / DSM 3721 / NBRC 107634 / OCM 161 / Z-7303) TaxID=644295 RepID=D7E8J3_METEZ|nr:hypothetical protein [Methanohalobium evestigatum]ADI73535.1 hypothetical protein Metev_0629 [Methanohalobium evestigatum Z-7303]